MQEIQISPYYQMLYSQTRICPEEWDSWNTLEFLDTNESPNPGQKTRHIDYRKKNLNKKNCRLVDCAILENHREKIKESKKIDEYLDLKTKKYWRTWGWRWYQ